MFYLPETVWCLRVLPLLSDERGWWGSGECLLRTRGRRGESWLLNLDPSGIEIVEHAIKRDLACTCLTTFLILVNKPSRIYFLPRNYSFAMQRNHIVLEIQPKPPHIFLFILSLREKERFNCVLSFDS